MADTPILVTGAAGNVGRAVVDQLAGLGVTVRAADLRPERIIATASLVAAVRLDLTDPATFPRVLAGVRRVFLIRPPAIARVGPTLNAFIDAAAAAGVEHIVFSSVAGADTNRIVPHHRIETHLARSDLDWTVLRPGFFAQNLATAYRTDIRDHDRIYLPAGDGKVTFVDTRDLGQLAATILTDPAPHTGRGYTLTGPRAVTFAEVATLLTSTLGRPITYQPASIPGYLRHLRSHELPVPQRLVQAILHTGLRRGDAEQVDPTLAQLLGRPPRDISDYIADHVDLWHQATAPDRAC